MKIRGKSAAWFVIFVEKFNMLNRRDWNDPSISIGGGIKKYIEYQSVTQKNGFDNRVGMAVALNRVQT